MKLREVHSGISYLLTLKKQSHFQILKINSRVTYCIHQNRDFLECLLVLFVCTCAMPYRHYSFFLFFFLNFFSVPDFSNRRLAQRHIMGESSVTNPVDSPFRGPAEASRPRRDVHHRHSHVVDQFSFFLYTGHLLVHCCCILPDCCTCKLHSLHVCFI